MGDHQSGPLPIDWEALAVAVENQLPGVRFCLNRQTGELRAVRQAGLPDDSSEWIEVERRSSRDGYRTMQRFLDQVDDENLRVRLSAALVGKGAFRRFKDILLDAPDMRQAWFVFKDAEVFDFVRRWLDEQGIEAAGEPPARMPAAVEVPDESGEVAQAAPLTSRAPDWIPGQEAEWREVVAAYDRPARRFVPEKTALLIVDMQRVFVDPKGSSYLPASAPLLTRLQGLVEDWRCAGLPVFFTRHVHAQPALDGGALARWWRSLIQEGSWESQIVGELQPRADEAIITKCRYSAFVGTSLEMMLRAAGVEAVLIGGVMTHLCCETTARDAFVRDFDVFFLGDGTASADATLHLSSLCTIAHGFGRVLAVDEAQAVVAASASLSRGER